MSMESVLSNLEKYDVSLMYTSASVRVHVAHALHSCVLHREASASSAISAVALWTTDMSRQRLESMNGRFSSIHICDRSASASLVSFDDPVLWGTSVAYAPPSGSLRPTGNQKSVRLLIVYSISSLILHHGIRAVVKWLQSRPFDIHVLGVVHTDTISESECNWMSKLGTAHLWMDLATRDGTDVFVLSKAAKRVVDRQGAVVATGGKLARTEDWFRWDERLAKFVHVPIADPRKSVQAVGDSVFGVSFKLELSDQEKLQRDSVVLPHELVRMGGTEARSGPGAVMASAGAAIYVDIAELDDEDPDSDLVI
eukprot:ANDGO_02620.mRNA.1 hypothetical protein